jgi:hypothetical protein
MDFYEKAFWLVVAFMLGNLISYGVFGLNAATKADVQAVKKQTTRIEMYLSSRDPSYWDSVQKYDPRSN